MKISFIFEDQQEDGCLISRVEEVKLLMGRLCDPDTVMAGVTAKHVFAGAVRALEDAGGDALTGVATQRVSL